MLLINLSDEKGFKVGKRSAYTYDEIQEMVKTPVTSLSGTIFTFGIHCTWTS
jgi:hypothetical protein